MPLLSLHTLLQAELGGSDADLRVSRVLGRGAFGVVYAGTWRSLPVAVKTMVVANAEEGTAAAWRQQQAVLEAAISLSMAHDNLVGKLPFGGGAGRGRKLCRLMPGGCSF